MFFDYISFFFLVHFFFLFVESINASFKKNALFSTFVFFLLMLNPFSLGSIFWEITSALSSNISADF